MTGATEFPYDSSVLFFSGISKEDLEKVLENDPFYKYNMIETYNIIEIEEMGKKKVDWMCKEYMYLCK